MAAFSAGEADILVATTVIEVGVDVPNATLMVIENADRFGLSQLHQLRGRVGRGKAKSYCVLLSANRSSETRQRLKALCATNDGFKIAEKDLELRGPGDFFGSRQHGLPQLQVADLAGDTRVLAEAKEAAEALLADDPELEKPENQPVLNHIRTLFEENRTFSVIELTLQLYIKENVLWENKYLTVPKPCMWRIPISTYNCAQAVTATLCRGVRRLGAGD